MHKWFALGLFAAASVMLAAWAPPLKAAAYGTSPVTPTALRLVASVSATDKFINSWSWYVARGSGLVASVLLTLLILSGVGQITGLTYRVLEPLPAWAIHRAVGLSFGVMVLIHAFVLLFDRFIGFDLADILVPFSSQYMLLSIGGQNLGSFYMALGILSLYAIAIIIISSLLWMQRKPKPWKLLHYLAYGVLAAVFVHGLFMGTDLKHGLLRWLWLSFGVLLLISIGSRLRRARTIGRHV